MITNCNCAERIDCGCTVSFDTYDNNLLSVLSVGKLIGGSCTFDEYVIDWYRNGVKVLVSGKGSNPEIEAYHPFTGQAAIPVPSGTYQPVLRYVVISGVRVFPAPKNCVKFCTDLSEPLPGITVLPINCGTTGGNPDSYYSFRIAYYTTQDYSLASRVVRFDLSQDGSTKYLALQFNGFSVADMIEAFYNDETTPLLAYICGQNLPVTNGGVTPNEIDWNAVKMVVNLTDRSYSAGDFITLKVTPSVKESNFNTQWTLDVKCLSADAFECNFYRLTLRDIDFANVAMAWNAVSCQYEVTIPFVDWIGSSYLSSNMYRYAGVMGTVPMQTSYNHLDGIAKIALKWNTSCTAYVLFGALTYNMAGQVTVVKSGTTATFTFTNINDYNVWVSSYNSCMNSSHFSNYSSDPANVNHYKWFMMQWQETMIGCGDSFVNRLLRFHYSSPVTFDSQNMIITVEMLNVSNGITQQDCVETYARVNEWVALVDNSIAQPDFSGTTVCRHQYPFNGHFLQEAVNQETDRVGYYGYYYHVPSLANVCPNVGWWTQTLNWRFTFFVFYVRAIITNTSDPVNNFRIVSQLDRDTGALTGTWVTVYEKQNGVQIIP